MKAKKIETFRKENIVVGLRFVHFKDGSVPI